MRLSMLWGVQACSASLLLGGISQALVDIAKVDHIPDLLQVVGLLVLILQVERMLPHVNAQQRHSASSSQRVLVRAGADH